MVGSFDSTITFIAVEDQLSVEDLSHCKAPNGDTCFNGIQSIETKQYLPSVAYPAYAIEGVALGKGDWFEINLLSNGNISESLENRTGRYVFVNFGDDKYTDESMSEKLTRHDRMITSFYRKFLSQQNRRIMVVFTGRQDVNRMRFPRDVSMHLEAETNSSDSTSSTKPVGYLWQADSVLLYYLSINLQLSNESIWMNVTSMTVQAFNGTESEVVEKNSTQGGANHTEGAANLTQSLKADHGVLFDGDRSSTINNGIKATKVVLKATNLMVTMLVNEADLFRFVITTAKGYWRATQFAWNDEPLVPSKPISAPNGFSYHCTPPITLTNKNATAHNRTAIGGSRNATTENGTIEGNDSTIERNRTKIVITWNGLQLEPKFVYVEGQLLVSFSEAYDCVGFVSIGVLSGLFVVFLLVFILFVGILCIMDIKPIDRFEDPKGPRMTFNVIE